MKFQTCCRICKSEGLSGIVDLGHCPPSDRFLTSEMLNEAEIFYPLKLVYCNDCGLAQLSHVVDRKLLFSDSYIYDSSTSKPISSHFKKLALNVFNEFDLNSESLIVDIGSNTGPLLQEFRDLQTKICGVDPAPQLAAKANAQGLFTIEDFWSQAVANQILRNFRQNADIIYTSIMGHVEDLHGFLASVNRLLDKDGIFIFESPYLAELFANLAYDTIYHEHLNYWSIKPAQRLLSMHDLEIFRVENNPSMAEHSLRVCCGKRGSFERDDALEDRLSQEEGSGVHQAEVHAQFAKAVATHRVWLRQKLSRIKMRGKRIVGISAPAKSTTLLNYCRIGTETLDYLTDSNPMKHGRYSPGMHIPIFSDAKLRQSGAEYGLILAWNHKDAIMNNAKWFEEAGGHFLLTKPPKLLKATSHDYSAIMDLPTTFGDTVRCT